MKYYLWVKFANEWRPHKTTDSVCVAIQWAETIQKMKSTHPKEVGKYRIEDDNGEISVDDLSALRARVISYDEIIGERA